MKKTFYIWSVGEEVDEGEMNYSDFYQWPKDNCASKSVVLFHEDIFTALYNSGLFENISMIYGVNLEYSEEGEFSTISTRGNELSKISSFARKDLSDEENEVANKIISIISESYHSGRKVYYLF